MKSYKFLLYSLFFFSFNTISAEFFVKNHQIYVAKECKPGDDIISLDVANKYKDSLQKLLIKENEEHSYNAFSIGDKNTIHLISKNIYDSPIITKEHDHSLPEMCLAKKNLKMKYRKTI
ncbi:hypothetical protein [Photobacterium kishitanii]|uniref:hypothetical protein n=1 Tax=Photobacterium kishitanii TaxID=318456 RepID=UPI000D152E9C|nr:hypothetical protein [Photobacterium kishitanii]PSU23141.1 hypothetical protein CTM84_03540 [Photobacterium kishitanii]